MQYAGIPDSIYNYTDSKNDYVDDYASRGIWVNYLAGGSAANPKQAGLNIPLHACLAFHTDAGVRDEVVGTLLGYFAVSLASAILPFALAFAGGTMLYVISDEMIPETHAHGSERGATYALLVGFCVMLVSDVLLG